MLPEDEPVSPGQLALKGCHVDLLEELGSPWVPDLFEGCKGPDVCTFLVDVARLCASSDAKFVENESDIYVDSTDRKYAHVRVPIADQEEYS